MKSIVFITTYIDKDLYKKCVLNNSFIQEDPQCYVIGFDNTNDNKNISIRYNQFIDEYDFTTPAWFIFCHSDWELREKIAPVLETLDKKYIYGPIGAFLSHNTDDSFVREYRGQCFEKKRDGSSERQQRCMLTATGTQVDTLDCQCVMVHSSLIQQHNLRFDCDLRFDLYVEDFCINSKVAHGISSKIVNIQCCHWNQLTDIAERPQYFEDLAIVNSKFPDALFGGIVTLLGGKSKNMIDNYTNQIPEIVLIDQGIASRGTIYHVAVDPNGQNDAKTMIYQQVTPGSTVLDIGCACGDLGIALKTHKNCTLYGLEYNPESVFVAQRTGAYKTVRQADLNSISDAEYPEFDGIFDYIVLGDVLEHLYDPQEVLRKILRYLKPGGRLLISFPNLAHISIKANLLLNDFSYTDVGLLDRTHIRFFTHKNIPPFLAANRLVIDTFEYTVWDILGFQSENPYPALPCAIKQFLLQDPHSFVCQYIIKLAVLPNLSIEACIKANGILHTIDEQKNPLLTQYRSKAFSDNGIMPNADEQKKPLPTQYYSNVSSVTPLSKRLRGLLVKCLIATCLLPATFIYAKNPLAWLRGICTGKVFFRDVVNSHYYIEKKLETKNRFLRIIVKRPLHFAMALKNTNSLRATLEKVKNFLQQRSEIKQKIIHANTNSLHAISRKVKNFVSPNSNPTTEKKTSNKLSKYMGHILRTEPQTEKEIAALSATIDSWTSPPLLTLHISIAGDNMTDAMKTIGSVTEQIYPHWEMWLTVTSHTHEALQTHLGKLQEDERIHIKVSAENERTMPENIALNEAKGTFFILLHCGDLLSPSALFYIAKESTQYPKIFLIYSDSDVISNGVRHSPFFKPDWNEELFLNQDYLCQLTAYNTAALRIKNGFRDEYAPYHAYDASLRLAANGTEKTIRHIPRVLYHYGHNTFCLFSKPYREKGRQAVEDYLKTKSIAATVTSTAKGLNRVTYTVKEPIPLVSCIIGMRDMAAITWTCLNGLLQKTNYKNLEIILVDNGSTKPESLALFTKLKKEKCVRIIHWDKPFNYSQIQNMAVNEAKGKFIALINNDIEVITPEWLSEMIGHAQKEHVGAVGAKLLFENHCLQHGGIILGPNGSVGHTFRDMHENITLQNNIAHTARGITAVTGACLVIDKKKYLSIGGLNETNLPIAFNDVDFCIRLHLAGYQNIYTPYATLYHHESLSRNKNLTPEKAKHAETELQYLITTYQKLLNADPQYNPNLSFYGTNYDVLTTAEKLREHRAFS